MSAAEIRHDIRHGGLVAQRQDGVWRAALIEGPSGVGKSDLALRALDQGFRLVADDRVVTFAANGRLYGKAHEALAGLIEVRGLGVIDAAALPFAEIVLLIRCVETPEAVERMPEPRFAAILGVSVPVFDLWPREPAAPTKIRRMMQSLGSVL